MSEIRPIPAQLTRELRRLVLRPHQSLEQLAHDEAAGSLAVGAFDGDALVGVGLLTPLPGPDGWQIRGMAVAGDRRGQGIGTSLLRALLDLAAQAGVTRVWCNARTPARSLYERAGFEIVSDEFELPMIGPHYVMALSLPARSDLRVSGHGHLDD